MSYLRFVMNQVGRKMDRRGFVSTIPGAMFAFANRGALGKESTRPFVPPRAVGVNCYDLFYGPLIGSQESRMASARLRELRMSGIPFVRFSASPYWPSEWASYVNNRSRYFSYLDAAFEAAEVNRIGLVPTLFWNPASVSERLGEPVSAWGEGNSATREFMAEYVSQVVTRYRGSSALWMWEFGNEFNTYVDLPNAMKWWPYINVTKGTASSRSLGDLLSSKGAIDTFRAFAIEVQRNDTTHLVTTGCDIPRSNAHNLSISRWEADSPDEFRKNLKAITPDPMDVISIHLYQNAEGEYFKPKKSTYSDVLSQVSLSAKESGKYSFIGEFGVPQSSDKQLEQSEFTRLLAAITSSSVDWAAMWVFDFPHQKRDWSVHLGGDRAYQLELIAQANSGLTGGSNRQ